MAAQEGPATQTPPFKVDHCFAPVWWQTAICLPDDWQKTLVAKEGALLYDFDVAPHVFRQFQTRIAVEFIGKTDWVRQELAAPCVPIVRTFKRCDGLEIIEEAFAVPPGAEGQRLEPAVGAEPPRQDVLLVTIRNVAAGPATATPALTIESGAEVRWHDDSGRAQVGPRTTVVATLKVLSVATKGKLSELVFEPVTLAPGGEARFAVCVRRNYREPLAPADLATVQAWRRKAQEYWEKLDLPYDVIRVPDAGVQAQLEAAVRNIYQAREIKNGLPAFQVGPTVYRGLWVVDGSFLMEAVAMLGRTDEARRGIQYLLTFQQPDGGFALIGGHWKETGIVLWAVTRHARLTRDPAWLNEVWPKVERAVAYIQKLRKDAATDLNAPNYRLMPFGFSDGGLSGNEPEYTNVYWNLAGLRAAAEAARWLGKAPQAAEWQREYDDFLAIFRRAAERDTVTDAHGNRCLPIRMRRDPKVPPQKAQWSFLHAVFPGQVFAPDDPLVRGNMAMLRSVESQDLVLNTGWLEAGIWTYFGSFYAHACLWLGDREKAIRSFYAFANHAAPMLVWREEQRPLGKGDPVVGDMPHNWASAEFIRCVRNFLILERGAELHLLEGLPAEWARPGMVTRVRNAVTEFGPVSLELRVNADGSQAHLIVETAKENAPPKVVVHLNGWSGREGTLELPAGQKVERDVPLAGK